MFARTQPAFLNEVMCVCVCAHAEEMLTLALPPSLQEEWLPSNLTQWTSYVHTTSDDPRDFYT